MYLLICKMFEDEDVDIHTHEIEQSYCPGKFDLSIDGKICWYFSKTCTWRYSGSNLSFVEGSGSKRAAMMRDFINTHSKEKQPSFVSLILIPNLWLH